MKEPSLCTLTRLTDLLEEVRGCTDLIGLRPINEYVDGVVKESGKHEYFCWHCPAVARMRHEMKHEPACLLARIDVAIAEANKT